jgi:hypothetical protein
MMNMKTIKFWCFFLSTSLMLSACTKDFLDKKPSKALLVPETINDFQALLDFVADMNVVPGLNVIASDDFYRQPETIASLNPVGLNSYLWAKDIFGGTPSNDWSKPYNQIFVANVVLDGLEKVDRSTNSELWDEVEGNALFIRGFALYNVAGEFAAPYDPATAASTPGLPIRLSSDVNTITGRGTLSDTYTQIIADLIQSAKLLPKTQTVKSRPIRAAAMALLSRVYLTMQQYNQVAATASSSLALNNTLLDYNTLNRSAARPFPVPLPSANNEILFYSTVISVSTYNTATTTLVDSSLFRSYDTNDLRKAAFFNDKGKLNVVFKGNYTGSSSMFGGLCTDEVYLNRAEAYVRENKVSEGLQDLNTLLTSRWKTGTFKAFTAVTQAEALALIVRERRKELIGRSLRWADLRRLNQDEAFKKTITRMVDGKTQMLLPRGWNYVFPIPDNEINASGIAQNPRD